MNGTKYAVTINCNSVNKDTKICPANIDKYSEHLSNMRANGRVTDINYEIGSQGRCHLHCTWIPKRGVKRHYILFKSGYFYECKPVRNVGAWNTYIRKDQPKGPLPFSINITNNYARLV